MLMSKVSVLHIDGKIAADTSASPCWSSPARRVPHVPTTSPCRGAQDRLRDGRWQKLVDGLGRQLAEGCSQLSREVAQSSEINRQRLQELVEAGRCHCVSIQSTRLRVFFFFFLLFCLFSFPHQLFNAACRSLKRRMTALWGRPSQHRPRSSAGMGFQGRVEAGDVTQFVSHHAWNGWMPHSRGCACSGRTAAA